MEIPEIIKALKRNMVETGSLICIGCGREHNCSTHGCAIMREAADALELLNRRATSENKPLMLEQLREMDGEPVWVQFLKFGEYGFVDYNADLCGDNVFITNNRGGCSTFAEILSIGGVIYARKLEGEPVCNTEPYGAT
jgi:hypothetical protein